MLAIAVIVEAGALLAGALVFGGVLRAVLRSSARREDLLVNQIMHLTGRTWQEPPREREYEPLIDEQVLVNPDQVAF